MKRASLLCLIVLMSSLARGDDSVYEVREGDSLMEISAIHYGTRSKWKEIAEWNGIGEPYVVNLGQKIKLKDVWVLKNPYAYTPSAAPVPAPVPVAVKTEERSVGSTPPGGDSSLSASVSQSKVHGDRMSVSVGFDAGDSYMHPSAQFQYALTDDFGVGVKAIYYNGGEATAHFRTAGGFLTGSYFLNGTPFKGFIAQTGAGFYSIQSNAGGKDTSISPFAAYGTLGWRAVYNHFSLGAAAGAQYVAGPVNTAIKFSGVLPLFNVELGYSF